MLKKYGLFMTPNRGAGNRGTEPLYISVKYHYAVRYQFKNRESIRTYTVPVTDDNPIVIKESDIMRLSRRNIFPQVEISSATSLNSYIDCSLSFYFQIYSGSRKESE